MGKRKLWKQYGALPFIVKDGELRVMLVTSRETRRWIIPKGWPEKNLRPHQVAAREAFEEAGLIGDVAKTPLASFETVKRVNDTKIKLCMLDVYLFAVTEELDWWPERDQRQREWMTPAEAALRASEAGLIEIFLGMTRWTDHP